MTKPYHIMTKPYDAAYPVSAKDEHTNLESGWGSIGLTKREEIAARVLEGFASDPGMNEVPLANIVANAVRWADALIEELNK